MFSKFVLLALFSSLIACATTTEYKKQEAPQDTGFRVENTDQKDTFYTYSNFKTGTKSKYIIAYVGRSVGETCQARGYTYFDSSSETLPAVSSDVESYRTLGFCYNSPQKKGLYVNFAPTLKDLPDGTALVIEEVGKNMKSKLRVGDVIKTVRGQRVKNYLELRRVLRTAVRKNEKTVTITLLRKQKPMQVKEGISSTGLAFDSKTLEAFIEATK